jgi:hypothetical protein
MTSICEGLDSFKDEYKICNIISKSIQNLKEIDEYKKIITIDDEKIEDKSDFIRIIENLYSSQILGKLFSENDKVHIKLKLNLREYIILTNVLYPRLLRSE